MAGYDEIGVMSKRVRVLKKDVAPERALLPIVGKEKEEEVLERRQRVMELYQAHSISIFKFLASLDLKRNQVEDIGQEVFLRLATHLKREGDENRENSGEKLRSWLFTVAHNLSMDLHRKQKRDKAFMEPMDEVTEEPIDRSSDPAKVFEQGELLRRVRGRLKDLTTLQRRSLSLRAQGLNYTQIGKVLGVSEPRARHLVKRAIEVITGGL